MERSDYLAALERDSAAFADSIAQAGLDAPVRSCPEWKTADLVHHLTRVHYFWGSIVAQRATAPDQVTPFERPADAELLDTYRRQSAQLLDVLSTTDPETEVWTWAPEHSVAFVLRRMALETATHRWDADEAAGRNTPIEAGLASDGIDEFLHLFLFRKREGADPLGGSVHIHCGDVSGEWTIRPTESGFDVTREHAKGDCALRGTASDLLLALWRRAPIDELDVVGDAGVAARFLAVTDLE